MVATAMPQQLSSMAVSGPPATTPVSGLPTSSGRQSSCMEASPRATASTFKPSALLWGMVSEKSCWNRATRSSGVVRCLAMPHPTHPAKSRVSALTGLNSRSYLQARRRQTARCRGRKLVIFLQLTLNGLAVGCIYGLVALGFVLIYKATELVNFAQGDLLMLGAFLCYMFVVWYNLGYWVAFALAILIVAGFGALLDWTVLRRVIGQPQFAVVMLTIGLGAVFRSFASITWGSEIYTLPTPFSAKATRIGGVTVSHEYVSIIAGTVLLCAVLYALFTHTKVGVAMQAASQNQLAAYYMGIPVKRVFSLIWAVSAAVATIAGVLLAPVSLIDVNIGFVGLKAFAAAVLGGFGSIPGALAGGITIGVIELLSGAYLPQGVKDVAAYVVLLVVLAVRPQGMFGTVGRKKV